MQGFLNPVEVFKKIRLRDNMVAADFGCGSGGWAIPLAKKLENGKVYAIDILEEPLSVLRSKTKLEKISNLEIIKSDVEKTSRLFENSCHLVLMTNLLFEIKDKRKVLEEGKRILRKGGRILVIDWTPGPLLGPGPENRVSSEEVKKIAEEIGLKLEKEFEAGIYHYGLIFLKP